MVASIIAEKMLSNFRRRRLSGPIEGILKNWSIALAIDLAVIFIGHL
jgi:hypothetical protein